MGYSFVRRRKYETTLFVHLVFSENMFLFCRAYRLKKRMLFAIIKVFIKNDDKSRSKENLYKRGYRWVKGFHRMVFTNSLLE